MSARKRKRPKDFAARVNAQTQPFVFSIRPKYVARILDGSKRWEYRTRRPSLMLEEMILIYETAPRSMIVARARVRRIVVGSPAVIWKGGDGERGVSAVEFQSYYQGRDRAVALLLGHVVKLPEPRPLPEGMAPPQSWSRYKGVWT